MFDQQIEIEAKNRDAEVGKPVQLPTPLILALIDKLAEDDDFRARFEATPRAALRELRYETPAAQRDVPGADPVLAFAYFHGGLASKQKIAAGRERWLAQLGDGLHVFAPFAICA